MAEEKKRVSPHELWTCRDWASGEPTEQTHQEHEQHYCPQCVDKATCKGPVRYRRGGLTKQLECMYELGYAIMYMNFVHPHRQIDKPFEDSSGWHNQRINVQTLCSKFADNQGREEPEWWEDFFKEIRNEIENMC